MSCDLARGTVHAYFDGELDAMRAAEFEQHMESCDECRTSLGQLRSLRTRMRGEALYHSASPQLRAQIGKQMGFGAATSEASSTSSWRWLLMPAVAVLVVAVVFSAALYLVQPHSESARITAELIDAHLRSLQPGHLTDVESTDQHTVKPWFDGKLSFIPPVADYSEQGFPLVGGRLDVVDGQNVAALVYSRRKHLINLFAWPYREKETGFVNSGSRQGYNWTTWQSGDMRFCLVSDVSSTDLRELKGLIHP